MSEVLSPSQSEGEAAKNEAANVLRINRLMVAQQQRETGEVLPALPLLVLPQTFSDILAQRDGALNKRVQEQAVRQVTQLLCGLIACTHFSADTTNRYLSQGLGCTPGEQYITQLKPRGFSIALLQPTNALSEVNSAVGVAAASDSLLIENVEPWSEVTFSKTGLMTSKRHTGVFALKAKDGTSLVNKGGIPKTKTDIQNLYLLWVADRNKALEEMGSSVRYVLLSAINAISGSTLLIIGTASDPGLRRIKNYKIHQARQAILPTMAGRMDYLPAYLQVSKLSSVDQKLVYKAVEKLLSVKTGLNNIGTVAVFIDELNKVEAFRSLPAEVKAYILRTVLFAAWIGTGNLEMPGDTDEGLVTNGENLGLNGRVKVDPTLLQ